MEKNDSEILNLTEKELVLKATKDRLEQKPPLKFESKWKQGNYDCGYYARGNRSLITILQDASKEKQFEIGRKDFINGISEENLTFFKKYPSYIKGYSEEKKNYLQEKGRQAYAYTVLNNFSLEEYIELMGTIDPGVKTLDFVIGFYNASRDYYEQVIASLSEQKNKRSK